MDRVILVSVLFLGVSYATSYGPGRPWYPYTRYPVPVPTSSPCDMEWSDRTTSNCSVAVTCSGYAAVMNLEQSYLSAPYMWKCHKDKEYDENEEEIDDTVKHINLKIIGNDTAELIFNDNSDFLKRIKKILLKDNLIDVPEKINKLTAIEDIEIHNYYINILNFTRFCGLKELRKLNVSGNSIKEVATNNETSVTSKLEILDLSHNFIENVVKSWKLGNLVNLTFLDLSHNAIKNIDVLAFEGLTQLRNLHLSHNDILHIGSSLSKLHNIEEITFDHNRITSIEINEFAGLDKIEKLNLSSNDIQFINSLAFTTLMNLKELDLSFNKLKVVEKQLLRYNNKLCTLLLNNNNIETLEPGAFEGKNITKFNIQNNNITGVINRGFQDISVHSLDLSNMKIWRIESMTVNSAVHKLNLSKNFINNIYPSAFSEVKHLRILDLSYNLLRSVNFRLSFSKMLTFLYLQHNQIEHVSQFTLKNLTMLEKLDLSDNCIVGIENKTFADLKKLESLRLNNNIQLRKFNNDIFDGLESLLYLDISYTGISELQNDLFSDLKQLETLNASNCKIEKIQQNAFKNFNSIEIIDLSFNLLTEFSIYNKDIAEVKLLYLTSNKIQSISDETFHGLSKLYYLGLSNNNIAHISDNAFDALKQLKMLDLASNTELTINTKTFDNLALVSLILKNITKRLNFEHTLNTRVIFLDLSSCQIENVDSLFVYRLDVQDLVLRFNKITQLHKHSFQNMSSLNYLDLSSNAISYIQPGAFLQLANLKTLNLHDNNISKLALGAFEGLKSLQTLNLSNNEISSFKNLNVRNLPSLKTISLDNNKLKSIMFTAFVDSGIEKITVGGNNIPCSDITNYYEPQRMFLIRRKLVVTAEVLDFHSENVDGIQCNHNTNLDDTYISPQTNATYVLANAIGKLQEILSNKTNLLTFDGNYSKVVNTNDTSQLSSKEIIKKMAENLNTASYHLENEHSDVRSLVNITVVCLVVIVIMYLTIFIPKVKHIFRYRLRRAQSAIPLVSNNVEM